MTDNEQLRNLQNAQRQEELISTCNTLREHLIARCHYIGRRETSFGRVLQLKNIARMAEEDSFDGTLEEKIHHYQWELALLEESVNTR